MNVADIMKVETKDALSQAIIKIQVLQELLKKEEAQVQPLVVRALKELGVDPGEYLLEMNPKQTTWILKPNIKVALAKQQAVVEVAPKPASDTNQSKEAVENTVAEVKV